MARLPTVKMKLSKVSYKNLLSDNEFLKVKERARKVSGIDMISIDFEGFEIRFRCRSVTDPKKHYTIIIQLDNLDPGTVVRAGTSLDQVLRDAKIKIYCNCLRRGTLVSTSYGLLPIEEILPGTPVLSGDGTFQPCVGVMSQEVSRYVYVIEASGGMLPLTVTGEHKLLIRRRCGFGKPVLCAARDLRVGDTMLSPRADGTLRNHTISSIESVFVCDTFYDVGLSSEPHTYVANGVIVSNCPAFAYWGFAYKSWKLGYGIFPENRFPKIRNPHLRSQVCKHGYAVLAALPFWSKSIAKQMRQFWTAEQGKQIQDAVDIALRRMKL